MSKVIGPENLDDPVGDHVSPEFATLRGDDAVGEALAHLRSRPLAQKIVYFYVVDADDRLVGVVPTRRLLMSEPDRKVSAIMVDAVISIPASASVLTACEFFILHRLLAFPVVDDDRRIVGVVDVNLFTGEIIGLAERRSADSAFQTIGVHVALGRKAPSWVSFKDRFPWLLCNITGGIACALMAGVYQHLLEQIIVLALFIPVVLALAESVSIQSMTLTLQALQQERINWRLVRLSLRQEFLTASLLGAASGLIVASAALVWKQQRMVALSVGTSILLAIVIACLLGVILPTLLRLFRDPKIAAGPLVLATADILTLLSYFGIARWMLT
ncbi:MAG: magnesium transporter [Planctomycetes bacterium]|nr:magnesium transporter [Planctomycetota bacterium]